MRRDDRAISSEAASRLLAAAEYGVLSMTSAAGVPHGIPLNFAFVNNRIYFHCAPAGKKVDLLASNPQVSFCVVGRTQVLPEQFGTRYESVIATGQVEELFAEEKENGLVLLIKKYSPAHQDEGREYIRKLIAKTKVFRINVASITGKARK